MIAPPDIPSAYPFHQAMDVFLPFLLATLGFYLLIGIGFSVLFVFLGVGRTDRSAVGAGLGFRLVILPGCAVFWPLLAWRWARGSPPPIEKSAHRRAVTDS